MKPNKDLWISRWRGKGRGKDRERERKGERLEENSDTVDLEAIIIPGCSFVQWKGLCANTPPF